MDLLWAILILYVFRTVKLWKQGGIELIIGQMNKIQKILKQT